MTLDEHGTKIFRIPSRSRVRSAIWGLPIISKNWLRARSSLVDVVHCHSVFLPQQIAAARYAKRTVLSPHGGYMPAVLNGRSRAAKKIWRAFVEDRFVRSVSALHAVSPSEAKQLESLFGHSRILTIPNAISLIPEAERALDRRYLNDWTFGFLGRLAIEQKGLDLLIDAYRDVRRNDSFPRLEIVGQDFRGSVQQIRNSAPELIDSNAVSLSGPIFGQDKNAFFGRIGVFVHTSRWEGLPFSVLEAMAWGCPVLVTPETNLAGKVEEFEAGWICTLAPREIATALRNISQLPREELKRRGANAIRLARESFSWGGVAKSMAELYHTLEVQS